MQGACDPAAKQLQFARARHTQLPGEASITTSCTGVEDVPNIRRQLTLLWQTPESPLRDWILEIFSPLIDREVFDGEHRVVLDNCLVADTNVHRVDPAYFAQFKGKNAFLLRQPDEYYRDVTTSVYANFCGVIRIHYAGAFRRERVMHVPVGYNRGQGRRSEPKPASQRKYAWAMLGQMNKATRPDVMMALLPVKPAYWYASDGCTPGAAIAASNESRNQSTADYQELLAESAFSPSPMGNVSQETSRPFGALESGSIPLLERRWSMDAHRHLLGNHPLPTFSDWKKAASFVESMWADKQALDQLQAECLGWWENYKKNLTVEADTFIDRLWQDVPTDVSQFIRWYARVPGWPAFELLRHHSAAALRRRVVRQTRRLIERGRLFERI